MARSAIALPETRLGDGEERLLRWLERYPFQRAQDLVVALAPWQKRTAVYARLSALERLTLLEVLRPGAASGKRVYHLRPLGTLVCDQLAAEANPENQEKRVRWERWGRQGHSQVIREEREKLVRLLPRLPVYFLLQDMFNGLIMNASSALTSQGRHARMVQWNWLRDYSHTFAFLREPSLRLRVEGALAWCLRFTSVGPQPESLDHAPLAEGWYTLLFLHCPIDEIRLIRTRLDRLLRWRESAERTAIYSHMPPLLVLATTERQAEWWHQAAEQVAARLHVNRPLGVLTCLPQSAEAWANGWHLPWRRLGTKEPCHLQEILQPLPAPAVPELLPSLGSSAEDLRFVAQHKENKPLLLLSSRTRRSSYALTQVRTTGKIPPASAGRLNKEDTAPTHEYRLASVHLTPRHWEMLRLCFAHQLLSRENFCHLLVLSRTTVNLLLADLRRADYLVDTETSIGERWQLGEAGLRLLSRLASCHVHRLIHFPLDEGAQLIQRGVPGLLHQIQHTASVYAFFSSLSQALATLSNTRLRWWETGVLSERHFTYREKVYRFRPDALASVQLGERSVRFWLEWDRGTMTPGNLQTKFATYAMYLASREWASSSPYVPALLCVAPDIAQERRLAQVATQLLTQVPSAFRFYTTTASLLATRGVLEPVWQQVVLSGQQTSEENWRRVAVFDERTLRGFLE